MSTPLTMSHTLNVISISWNQAENAIRNLIQTRYPNLDEEIITVLFYHELRIALENASMSRQIERAFFHDLKDCSWNYDLYSEHELEQFASGLVAQASGHPRHVERKTGGDFGLSIARPFVSQDYDGEFHVENRERKRGLLCQAKVKQRNGHWGKFTANQKRILPERMDYLALCLYEYADSTRTQLQPFNWQVCKGNDLSDVESWLKTNAFPAKQTSGDLLQSLGSDKIGTTDAEILARIIHPNGASAGLPNIHIRVFWPDSKKPPRLQRTHVFQHTPQAQVLHVQY